MNELLDKFLGCFIGGAVGDALGAPLEFDEFSKFKQMFDKEYITEYVEFDDERGEFSDDTQMSLFTAEGLLVDLNSKKNNPLARTTIDMVHDAYIRWLFTQTEYVDSKVTDLNPENFFLEDSYLYNCYIMRNVRFPGTTCLTALSEGVIGTISNTINDRKGCGGIMRVAPVGLAYRNDPEKSFHLASAIAAITHSHPTGYLTAGFLSSTISYLSNNNSLLESINKSITILKTNYNYDETLDFINKALDLNEKTSNEVSVDDVNSLGKGFVAEEALAIALFCSLKYEHNINKGIFASINHDGDSDSTGAITGNILGTINGFKSINKNLIDNLIGNELVEKIAIDFFNGFENYDPKNKMWENYNLY